MNNNILNKALSKGANGERLEKEEILSLAKASNPSEVHQLGKAALANKLRRFGQRATYIKNLHINPSNICEGGCSFCKYSVKPGSANARTLSEEEIFNLVKNFKPNEVHIVGGINEVWNYQRSLNLVKSLHSYDESLYIKGFTAVEIAGFARSASLTTKEVLREFHSAGLNGLPGGGAEIFSRRLRQKYCPDKLNPAGWLQIHLEASELGLKTNATMLYGLEETAEERVEHLLALREAQDKTQGFNCFIPLAYQSENGTTPAPLLSLAITALARLVLDNFPHIKAYWPMLGLETASAALGWGADDLDGTLGEEQIAHAAGATTPKSLSIEQMEETIRLAGFTPVERDGWFNNIATRQAA